MKRGLVAGIVIGIAVAIAQVVSSSGGEESTAALGGERDRDRDPGHDPSPSSEPEPAPEPAHGHPMEAPPQHAHPITPEREQIQRENQLVGALNDAMDLNDVREMRRLIEIYREHDPADPNRMQEGYTRIADCLQEPGPEAVARARAYYDTERASTLRRYVRRACLD